MRDDILPRITFALSDLLLDGFMTLLLCRSAKTLVPDIVKYVHYKVGNKEIESIDQKEEKKFESAILNEDFETAIQAVDQTRKLLGSLSLFHYFPCLHFYVFSDFFYLFCFF